MIIIFNFITGAMVGFEYFREEEPFGNTHNIVVDLFLLRLIFIWDTL